jgi:ribosome maturation factor RimP
MAFQVITACRRRARTGDADAWSGYSRTRQTTAQVVDEEVVMRADSRHGLSHPGRGRPEAPAAPRSGRPDVEPAELERLLAPIVRAAGLDLESVRVASAGRRRLLRVVVDADGGVSLDDIALVSREASARLDDTGAMGEAPYTLEVSSPGVDRPLTQPRHWRRATGRLVRVPVTGPGGEAATLEGRVITAGQAAVTLEVGGEQREFGYAELGPGHVQVEFGRPEAGPAGPGHRDTAAAAAATGPRARRADGH